MSGSRSDVQTINGLLDVPPGLGIEKRLLKSRDLATSDSWRAGNQCSSGSTEHILHSGHGPGESKLGGGYSADECPKEKDTNDSARPQQPSARRIYTHRRGRRLSDVIAELDWVRPRKQPTFELAEADVETSEWHEAGVQGKSWVIESPSRKTLVKNRFLAENYWTCSDSGDEDIDSVAEEDRAHEVY